MLDGFVEKDEMLELFFSFLDRPAPIDPAVSGFFRKTMVILITRKYEAVCVGVCECVCVSLFSS